MTTRKHNFERCCGRKPDVITWGRQYDKQGRCYDENAGVYVKCKKCGAELTIRSVIEKDEELDELIQIAEKEWNCGKKFVFNQMFERNYKRKCDS